MKFKVKYIAALTMFIFINVFLAYGQFGPNAKTIGAMERAKQEYTLRSNDEKKLQFGTYELLRVAEAADTSDAAKQKFKDHLRIDKSLKADSKERIRVMIHLRSVDDCTDIVKLIQSLDGFVEETYKDFPYILCKIHPKQLRNIISSKSVLNIKENIEGITQTVTSAGDAQLNADKARAKYPAAGANVNVGVISDGVDNCGIVPSDELPWITVANGGTGNEGTAMLEIVHDLAPKANLYFYSGWYGGYIGFAQGIKTLSGGAFNCKIIVDDLGYLNEPYFSDDDLDLGQAIRDFLSGGGVLVSAAGNDNYYTNANPNVYVFSGTTNPGAVDNINIFPNGQPDGQSYLSCTVNAGKTQYVYLEWANQWTSPIANYGLYINDNNGQPLTNDAGYYVADISGGDNSNPPIDWVEIKNNSASTQTYQIVVQWIKGDRLPVDFKITCKAYDGDDAIGTLVNNYTDNKQIFGHKGYPNVIGVAAYQASSPSTISSYSSRGPLTMYSTATQAWIPGGVNTPVITATSGVKTWIGTNTNPYGDPWWKAGNPVFNGTSASAPHIAGIAAIYFSTYNDKSLNDFTIDLTKTAVAIDGGTGGTWNNKSGYGKANALACLDRAANKVATPKFDPPPTGKFAGSTIHVTITSTPGAEIHYTINGTGDPDQNSTIYPSSGLTITPTCTLKAIAYLSGMSKSNISTGIYTLTTENGNYVAQVNEDGKLFGNYDVWDFDSKTWDPNWPNGTTYSNSGPLDHYDIRASQTFVPNTSQKFWRWEVNDQPSTYQNYGRIYFNINVYNRIIARFKTAVDATIQSQLIESGDLGTISINFKDPWFPDQTVADHENTLRNRGPSPILEPLTIGYQNVGTGTDHNGVFLNQELSGGVFYSVYAPQIQTIDRFNSIFVYWSATGADIIDPNNKVSNVVFRQPNATITGRYTIQMPPGTPAKFSTKIDFSAGSYPPNSIAIGDLNGDGKPDLAVVSEYSNTLSVLLNTTTSATTLSFSKTEFATGSLPVSVAIGDFNGDGKPDIAIANGNSNTVSVLLNTTTPFATTPTFSAKSDFATGSNPKSVAIGDVNRDEKPDLIVANYSSNTVSVLLNTTTTGISTPSFSANTDFATGSLPVSVAICDLNDNSKPDLVVVNDGSNTVSVLLNTTGFGSTTPSFSDKTDFVTGNGPTSVAIGDMNCDGKPDIAVSNFETNTVSILLNKTTSGATTPSFSVKTDFATASWSISVAIGDLNSDGNLDLAVANAGSNTVSVLLNTTTPLATTPTFSAKTDLATGNSPVFVAIGDLNGDGRWDLSVANSSPNTVSVFLNTKSTLASGTISNNTIWNGNIVVTSNVTVNSGTKLTIAPGTSIFFANNSSLTVNGVLIASGISSSSMITFDRSGTSGTWGGIIYNSGSSGTLSYCTIQNATTGVNCNGYLPQIMYCTICNNSTGIRIALNGTSTNYIIYNTIQNNSSCGISTSYSSFICQYNIINNNGTYGIFCNNPLNSPLLSPVLYNNKITNHSVGLWCYTSSPYLGVADVVTHIGNVNNKGSNVITRNGTGIAAAYGSNVFLGQGNPGGRYGGYNSIFSNTNYAIYAYCDTKIYADYNWWNGTPNIYQNPANIVSILYPLTSNPNPLINSTPNGAPIAVGNSPLLKTSSSASFVDNASNAQAIENQINNDLASEALQSEYQGKTDEAISNYQKIFVGERNTPLGRYALRKLNECYWKLNRKAEFDEYINTSVRPQISKIDELSALLMEFENQKLYENKEYDGIVKNLKGMLNDYKNIEPIYKQALYNLGSFYLQTLNDSSQSTKYFSKLAAEFPKDPLVVSAQYLLGMDRKDNTLAEDESILTQNEIPKEFLLANNYPNPFNPSTMINFQLPGAGTHYLVSLKVYDILGRQVATLVNEVKSAGYYSTTFDASHLSSGIYFARFIASSEDGNKPFTRVIKMLMMK